MSKTEKKATILIVDDVPGNIRTLAGFLQNDYQILMATNGLDALEIASTEQPDMILLDIVMPEMDGYAVCRELKTRKDTKKIEVVFVTSNTSTEQIIQGIEAGAFYYLTKPVNPNLLRTIVKSTLSRKIFPYHLHHEAKQLVHAASFINEVNFRIRIMDDALCVASFLSNMCPDPERVILGLQELLINAVEHGSLGITYEDKTNLQENYEWKMEVERRQALSEYRNRYVSIQFSRTEEQIRFLIKDEGQGFDWESYLEFDPKRIFDTHGRGIALSKMQSFDCIEYHGVGNEVLAVIYNRSPSLAQI